VNGTVATFDDASQAATGNYVPITAGYMGPWVWSTNGPVPIGSAGAYGWTSGASPPVGPQAATGWVAGLPEQARGTTPAVPNQNPLANPAVSSATAPSTVNPMTGLQNHLFFNQTFQLMLQEAMLLHLLIQVELTDGP